MFLSRRHRRTARSVLPPPASARHGAHAVASQLEGSSETGAGSLQRWHYRADAVTIGPGLSAHARSDDFPDAVRATLANAQTMQPLTNMSPADHAVRLVGPVRRRSRADVRARAAGPLQQREQPRGDRLRRKSSAAATFHHSGQAEAARRWLTRRRALTQLELDEGRAVMAALSRRADS